MSATDGVNMTSTLLRTTVISKNRYHPLFHKYATSTCCGHQTYLLLKGILAYEYNMTDIWRPFFVEKLSDPNLVIGSFFI